MLFTPLIDMTDEILIVEKNAVTGEVVERRLTGADAEAYRASWEVSDELKREWAKNSRAAAYRLESDPLFFKAQRGEATTDEWTAKVAEIKARFPYPGGEE